MKLPDVVERKRIKSPTVTPQALAWDGAQFWMSSRDLGTLYRIDITPKIVDEIDPPGIVWAAVATDGAMHFTIGKGLNDDRYVYRYIPGEGFSKLFACPDFTGSYLSFDGKNLYLSQWYEKQILKYDENGKIVGKIDIGAEICGHTFVGDLIYVLRGKENKDVPNQSEEWRPRVPGSARGRTKRRRSRDHSVCIALTHVRRQELLVKPSRRWRDQSRSLPA